MKLSLIPSIANFLFHFNSKGPEYLPNLDTDIRIYILH
jgi:hypothetical protein